MEKFEQINCKLNKYIALKLNSKQPYLNYFEYLLNTVKYLFHDKTVKFKRRCFSTNYSHIKEANESHPVMSEIDLVFLKRLQISSSDMQA